MAVDGEKTMNRTREVDEKRSSVVPLAVGHRHSQELFRGELASSRSEVGKEYRNAGGPGSGSD
jgi:hypothetical protein